MNICFFALLRPGDLLLSISGKPYDTLDEVIGIKENSSSLKSFGINYDQIELINDDFNYQKIEEYLKEHFEAGEYELAGDGGLDRIKDFDDWLVKIKKDLFVSFLLSL